MPNESFFQPSFRGQTVDELRRELQFSWQQMAGRLDELAGKRGIPAFFADIDTQGHRIMNVGMPGAMNDAALDGLSLGRSTFYGPWDAQGEPIQNLPRGVEGTDAVNVGQLSLILDEALARALPSGIILLWSGSVASVPAGWLLCDGTGGTPNLTDRFVVGAGTTYNPDDTGGADTHALAHTHTPNTLATNVSAAGTASTVSVDNNLDGSTTSVATGGHVHSHSHTVDSGITSSALSTIDNKPLYYALAYIMKAA